MHTCPLLQQSESGESEVPVESLALAVQKEIHIMQDDSLTVAVSFHHKFVHRLQNLKKNLKEAENSSK